MKSIALVAAVLLLALQLSHGKLPATSLKSPIQTKNNDEHYHRRRFTNFHQQNAVNVVASIPAAKSVAAKSAGDPWYFNIVPIYPKELAKFFSLSMMMFWIVFIFTMTRDTKDALIVTTCGSEAIAFLKVYGVVPAAGAFMLGYAKMANSVSPRSLFYATLAPFVIFYLAFAFILYPLKDYLHPLSIVVPKGGMSFAVNLVRHWTFSLYYIVSELWGSAGIPLLFWSCANDVVKLDQVCFIFTSILLALLPSVHSHSPLFIDDFRRQSLCHGFTTCCTLASLTNDSRMTLRYRPLFLAARTGQSHIPPHLSHRQHGTHLVRSDDDSGQQTCLQKDRQ